MVALRYDMRSKKSVKASKYWADTLDGSVLSLKVQALGGALFNDDVLCNDCVTLEEDVMSDVVLFFLLLSLEIFLKDLQLVARAVGPMFPSGCLM